jgi:DNA-binding response OmpR family regulator
LDDLDIQRSCFKDGALDYISKPFRKNDLIIKIERLLMNPVASRVAPTRVESTHELVLDSESLRVKLGNTKGEQLTAKELQIFSLLFQAKGQPLSREEVKVKVWGNISVSPKTFDVHLFHLRKKLKALGIEIRFNPVGGYFLSRSSTIEH